MNIRAFALPLLSLGFVVAAAQEPLKPLDPAKAHTTYSFPVRPGVAPFRFHVELSQVGEVTGLSIFREGEAGAFQILPACKNAYADAFTEYDQELDLLEHADLNFDGFEDLKLLVNYLPHLGTKVFCFYTWNPKRGRFRDAPDVPAPNPVPHPGNKTITTHQDWFGGVWADSSYRWTGVKFQLTEEHGRGYGSDDPKCGFTDHCEKLINGQMVTTLLRPAVCSDDRPELPLVCPAAATHAAPSAAQKKTARKKQEKP